MHCAKILFTLEEHAQNGSRPRRRLIVSFCRRAARDSVLCALAAALQSTVAAQPDPSLATFEVASVRQHQGANVRSGPLAVAGPLIRLEGYTVYGLIMDAWHLRDFQLNVAADIPKDDIYNKMYDIVARAPGAGLPAIDQVRAMLRSLLADRFGLKVHRETKVMRVYVLRPGRNGPKLKESTTDGPCSVRTGLASDGRNDEEIFSHCPIERLADRLRGKIDNRPILDRTGLTGRYDMRLIAAPEARTRSGPDPADIDPVTAVKELGLTLAAQRAAIEMIDVDRLETPTEN